MNTEIDQDTWCENTDWAIWAIIPDADYGKNRQITRYPRYEEFAREVNYLLNPGNWSPESSVIELLACHETLAEIALDEKWKVDEIERALITAGAGEGHTKDLLATILNRIIKQLNKPDPDAVYCDHCTLESTVENPVEFLQLARQSGNFCTVCAVDLKEREERQYF